MSITKNNKKKIKKYKKTTTTTTKTKPLICLFCVFIMSYVIEINIEDDIGLNSIPEHFRCENSGISFFRLKIHYHNVKKQQQKQKT